MNRTGFPPPLFPEGSRLRVQGSRFGVWGSGCVNLLLLFELPLQRPRLLLIAVVLLTRRDNLLARKKEKEIKRERVRDDCSGHIFFMTIHRRFRVWDSGFSDQRFGFRDWGSGFRVWEPPSVQ